MFALELVVMGFYMVDVLVVFEWFWCVMEGSDDLWLRVMVDAFGVLGVLWIGELEMVFVRFDRVEVGFEVLDDVVVGGWFGIVFELAVV